MASFLTHSKPPGTYDLRGCVHTSSVSVVLVQPPLTNRPSVLLSTLPAGLPSEIHTWLIADFCFPLEAPHGTALPWLWERPLRPLSSTLSVSLPCCVFLHSAYYQILEVQFAHCRIPSTCHVNDIYWWMNLHSHVSCRGALELGCSDS